MSRIHREARRRVPDEHRPTPRARLREAREDLHAGSPWREVLTTALEAIDEQGAARHRALCWLHHAIDVCLPSDSRRDSNEQRVLRAAAQAIEDELDAGGAQPHAA